MLQGQIVDQISKKYFASKENVINQTLANILGEFELYEIMNRIKWVKMLDGKEVLELDGRPILEFYPPEFNSYSDEDSIVKYSVEQKYKVLYDT